MSHFTLTVIVPKAKADDIEGFIAEILEPYSENKETPVYVKQTKAEAIAAERLSMEEYRYKGAYGQWQKNPAEYEKGCTNDRHIDYLKHDFIPEYMAVMDSDEAAYKRASRWYEDDEIDAEGNLLSTYNPNSKWDWWVIGGRWSGYFNAKLTGEMTVGWDGKEYEVLDYTAGTDTTLKGDLLAEPRPTFAILTEEDGWHERGKGGWWGMVSNEKDAEDWAVEFAGIIAKADDEDTLVLVDFHI